MSDFSWFSTWESAVAISDSRSFGKVELSKLLFFQEYNDIMVIKRIVDCIHHDQKGLACFMMSFFLLKCTSEVICLNQFLSFCNSNHIQNLLCERELKVNMIPVLLYWFLYCSLSMIFPFWSFWLVSIPRKLVSLRSIIKYSLNSSYTYVFDALMTQMKNPAINMFNDSSILSTYLFVGIIM